MAKQSKRKPPAKKRSGGSEGYLTHAGVAAAMATIGILVAFALAWWQVVLQPRQDALDLQREQLLNQYTQLLNGRIAELRQHVDAMATSPATVAALVNNDPEARERMGQQLAEQNAYVARADLIRQGEGVVDLNAEVPISFAALDLIRRAESREFVGPEVSLNQKRFIYSAQPITHNGTVAGVLLVVFSDSFFAQPLDHFDRTVGTLQINQKFQGTPSTAVMEWGSSGNATHEIDAQLFAPHWTLTFAASDSALLDSDASEGLLVPLALAWLVTMAAIFLGFSGYGRKVREDAAQLDDYLTRSISGRSAHTGEFHLDVLRQVAASVAQALPSAATNATKSTQPDLETAATDDGADLLDGLENTPPPTPASDDFLEVRAARSDNNFGIEVSENVGPIEMGLKLDRGIFRAYDIRGITTTNLTEDVVYWIGRAFASQAVEQGHRRVAVGWDGRHSSEPLRQSLTKGLTESGADVITIGQVPTPALYYATHALDTGTGIMITGSHNPPEYNGLKMMIGGVTLAEDAIQALYERLVNNQIADGDGDVEDIDLDDSYIDRMLEDVAIAQAPKVVVDCGNGVAGKLVPRLLQELGCEVVPLYCDVDGDFPNHHPDPADPKNLQDLITVVQAENADLGLAFDGDGDRLGVVTNAGEIVWPDKLIMLFAQDIVGRNPGADIVYDVKCSRHLNTLISELGGRPIMCKTGHSHIKAKLRETGALLGGEFSGHICFSERWYGFDDALYAAVRLLEILGSESRSADEVFKQFPATFSTPEIKITTTEGEKFKIMERLQSEANFGSGTVTTIDGIRVDFSDGWGLIRPSNTSPVLTLRFEADGPAALDRIQDEFQAQLAVIAPDLKFR